jgi:hypothetical protein
MKTNTITMFNRIALPTVALARTLRRIESTTRISRVRDYLADEIRQELQWRARCAQEALRAA